MEGNKLTQWETHVRFINLLVMARVECVGASTRHAGLAIAMTTHRAISIAEHRFHFVVTHGVDVVVGLAPRRRAPVNIAAVSFLINMLPVSCP